jgi:hypothetical protein
MNAVLATIQAASLSLAAIGGKSSGLSPKLFEKTKKALEW